MDLAPRQVGRRCEYSPADFPLTDSQGLLVDKNRRRNPDRRRAGYGHAILRAAINIKKSEYIRNRLIAISLIVASNATFILLIYALIVAFHN
jgi:hypothetical protein